MTEIQRLHPFPNTSVLIAGESGTGKELVARAIHFSSARAKAPFVPVNCVAIPSELAESILFGHVKGAFTGAMADRKGCFELADGGTLFLDEIGDMPIALQVKLLRVLETHEFIKVGDTRPTKVDVRIIAATNRDLQQEVNEGRFRDDLFYRLNVFTISLPPLRERKKDIPLIAAYYLRIFSAKGSKRIDGMSRDFLALLQQHEWKGNIRELKNVIERATILSDGIELTTSDLPAELRDSTHRSTGPLSAFDMASMEKLHIQRVLNYTKGNKTETARLLNIGLTTLYRKIEEYHISYEA